MSDQYFSKFPKMTYDITGTGTQHILVTDIIHRVQFRNVVKSNAFIYYDYTVKDGETPEIIAHKMYGSSQYHWVILFANDIYSLWDDWPLTYSQFLAYLEKVYGDVDTAVAQIHHYEDADGNWIDLDTYNATIADGSKVVYAYDYEDSLNEAKKDIKILDPKYLSRVEEELDRLLIYK